MFKESYDRFRDAALNAIERYELGEYLPVTVEELGRPWAGIDYRNRQARFLDLVALARVVNEIYSQPFPNEVVAYAKEHGLDVRDRDKLESQKPENLAHALLDRLATRIDLLGTVGIAKAQGMTGKGRPFPVAVTFTFFRVREEGGRFRVSITDWPGIAEYLTGLNALLAEED